MQSTAAVEPQQDTSPVLTDLPAAPVPVPVPEDLLAQDLLVEDVSIDGMCGVY